MQEPFKKICDGEYEISIKGAPRIVKTPFEVESEIFKIFISKGGVIDFDTGDVTTDIPTLISSFKEIGDILLTDYDYDTGKVISAGNCRLLNTIDVINLFLLAVEVVKSFSETLHCMKNLQVQPEVSESEEKSPTTETTKD